MGLALNKANKVSVERELTGFPQSTQLVQFIESNDDTAQAGIESKSIQTMAIESIPIE